MQIAQIESQLQQVITDYDARTILAEIALRFYQRDYHREMFTLLSARPIWDVDRLILRFTSQFDAFLVRPLYRTIAAVLYEREVKEAIVVWGSLPHQNFRVVASMAMGESIFDTPPPLDVRASVVEAIRLGDLVRSSENPMGVVVLDSDWQIWGNTALSVMCQKPLEELCRTNVRANWVNQQARTDDGLTQIKQRLTREQDFHLNYTTKLSAEATGKHHFESRFRLVLGGRFRLTEIFSYLPS